MSFNMLKRATEKQLINAERLAIKYSPKLALAIAKEYYNKQANWRRCYQR